MASRLACWEPRPWLTRVPEQVPETFVSAKQIWDRARAGFAMFCCLIFLISVGGGS